MNIGKIIDMIRGTKIMQDSNEILQVVYIFIIQSIDEFKKIYITL
jgi:hypothetical protein